MTEKTVAVMTRDVSIALKWCPSKRRLLVTAWCSAGCGGIGCMDEKVWDLESLCKELGITHKDLEATARRLKADALVDLVRRS